MNPAQKYKEQAQEFLSMSEGKAPPTNLPRIDSSTLMQEIQFNKSKQDEMV